MAKTKAPTANPRSRAAKRATSPSINVDKSIKDAPRALGTDPILGVTRNSGVSKKKKVKHMTRGQRVRQEKGLARAEAVMNQMEKKIDGAKSKLKTRNTRKSLWEDINDASTEELRKTVKGPGMGVIAEVHPGQEVEHEGEASEIEMEDTNLTPQGESFNYNALEEEPSSTVEQVGNHTVHEDDSELIT